MNNLILSIISGILYRLGGYGDPWNTKVRDLGCPTIALLSMWLMGGWNWWLIPCFFFFFGALTTYWSELQKPDDEVSYLEWALTGFIYGLAFLPYAWATGRWLGFGVRVAILACFMPLWSYLTDLLSKYEGMDNIGEWGRGYACNITLPLLLM